MLQIGCLVNAGENLYGLVLRMNTWFSIKKHIHYNILRVEQTGCHFAETIFKCILLAENICVLLQFQWNVLLSVQLLIIQPGFR